MTDGALVFYTAVMSSIVSTGLITWLFGQENRLAIGSSGLIYGLLGFITLSGVLRRTIRTVAMSLITVGLYSGSLTGLMYLPFGQRSVSYMTWVGHVGGFLGGATAAWATGLARDSRSVLAPRTLIASPVWW